MKTLVIALLVIASGCSVLNTEEELDTNPLTGEIGLIILEGESGKQNLQEAREKWDSLSSPTYTYSFTHLAYIGLIEPYEIVVEENAVTDVIISKTGKSAESEFHDFYTKFTIDGLFDYTQNALDKAYEVRVKFNEEFGYPVSVYIDYDENVIDEEEAFQASDYDYTN